MFKVKFIYFLQGAAAGLLFAGSPGMFLALSVMLAVVTRPWVLVFLAMLYDLAFFEFHLSQGFSLLPITTYILFVSYISLFVRKKFLW